MRTRAFSRLFVRRAVPLCASLCLLLSGCTYGQTGIEGLLQPPRLSGEQNDIYNALLAGATGSDIRLQYPRAGEYTSAFVLHNLDAEETEEAVVFYSPGNDGSMRLNLLDREDGVWVSKYDTPCPRSASEIEKVGFIEAEGKAFLLVGYALTDEAGQSIRVYAYEDGKLTEKSPISCTSFEVFDINGDGKEELITISQPVPMGEDAILTVLAECGVFTEEGRYRMMGSAEMDPSVEEYPYIHRGVMSDGRPALYLDGEQEDGSWTTEILAYDGRELKNFVYSSGEAENLIEKTRRSGGIVSYDRNGDGLVHIPNRELVPSSEDTELSAKEYFTEWYIYNVESGGFILRDVTYVSYALGYIFSIPKSWQGWVTVEYSAGESEVNFYEYDRHGDEPVGEELLSIRLVARSEYERAVEDYGYELLWDKGQYVYLYQIYPTSSWMTITDLEVQASFQLYNS